MPIASTPPVRRVTFDYPEDFELRWHPRLPEFAAGANAVSMLMPHAEPFVARSVRAGRDQYPDDLAARAEGYVGQETQHYRQHRRFNQLLLARYGGLGRLDRTMAAVCRFLERRSVGFGLGFAAGFETVAYSAARWTAKRRQDLLGGADPTGLSLFLWHLAEEVEHKAIAYEAWRVADGSRLRLMAGTLAAMVLLAVCAVWGTLVILATDRRLLHPLAHIRLAGWTLGLTFTVLPDAVASWLPNHRPADLADPLWYVTWLAEFDGADGENPMWTSSRR